MSEEIIKLPNPRTTIEWTSYLATAYAEGFCEGENATFDEQIEAGAYLIKTKLCYSLQGSFGRVAKEFIEREFILEDGTIDWELIEDSKE